VDIGPDLKVWPCFPLTRYSDRSLLEFNHLQEILEYFTKLVAAETRGVTGVFEQCDGCHHMGNHCNGGCSAHYIPEA
jgi:radical SAM protein with 4Fe4S-binding SPASM domain